MQCPRILGSERGLRSAGFQAKRCASGLGFCNVSCNSITGLGFKFRVIRIRRFFCREV